jgi:hypothetical protein
MLTGPNINACFVPPSHGIYLTRRGEKYVQYYTIFYNVQELLCGFLNAKKPFLVVVFSATTPSALIHMGKHRLKSCI